jgi:hypothetical protein
MLIQGLHCETRKRHAESGVGVNPEEEIDHAAILWWWSSDNEGEVDSIEVGIDRTDRRERAKMARPRKAQMSSRIRHTTPAANP